MKPLSFFMAWLVLSLSCLPCADCDAMALKSESQKIGMAKPCSQKENDHNEGCSPFCQCACCAGFLIYHNFTIVGTLPTISCKNSSSNLEGQLIEISIPVWQPPKI